MFSIWNTFFILVTDIRMRSDSAPLQWPWWNMLCSLPVSISMSLILLNAYVRRETANMLSTNVLLKTENLDLSWLCLNMMHPSWTNYLLNSSISLISLTLTSSAFVAFLISLFSFTKFARYAYLSWLNLLLVVWKNLMIVYHGAV